jgi:ketosteroid isomerase-like protein
MTPTVEQIADRFVAALENNDAAALERLYHPRLRFAVRTAGTEFDRDGALANFRTVWTHLRDVRVEVVDRQRTTRGYLSQQVLTATVAGGARLRVPMCMVVDVADGAIVAVDEYFDTAAVGALADLRPAS